MSGLKLRDFNCGFKAYRREVIEDLNVYGELYRYIPVVVHAKGFRVGEIAVSHRERQYGESKYGLERFIRGPLDLFTIMFLISFQKRPLHLFGPIGVIVGSIGFLPGSLGLSLAGRVDAALDQYPRSVALHTSVCQGEYVGISVTLFTVLAERKRILRTINPIPVSPELRS